MESVGLARESWALPKESKAIPVESKALIKESAVRDRVSRLGMVESLGWGFLMGKSRKVSMTGFGGWLSADTTAVWVLHAWIMKTRTSDKRAVVKR